MKRRKTEVEVVEFKKAQDGNEMAIKKRATPKLVSTRFHLLKMVGARGFEPPTPLNPIQIRLPDCATPRLNNAAVEYHQLLYLSSTR